MTDDVLAVSPDEAARRLGLGRTTVYALLRDGDLPSVKCGARRLVRVEALAEWLRRQETNACERAETALDKD